MFYSYILALGFNFIFKKDEKEENHKRMLRTLELYGQTRNLPPDLRARLKKYFDFQQIKKVSERKLRLRRDCTLTCTLHKQQSNK